MSLLRAFSCRNRVEPGLDDDRDVIDILDKLGYSKSLAEKRCKIYHNAAEGGNLVYREKANENIDIIIAGSRGEGIGIYFDTDVDKLFVKRSVKCFETRPGVTDEGDAVKLVFDTEKAPSGYTKLLFIDEVNNVRGNIEKRIKGALVNINGKKYLRNNELLTEALSRNVIWKNQGWLCRNLRFPTERTGPSKPYVAHIPFTAISVPFDDVLALPCFCPNIVTRWRLRERTRDWPSDHLIGKVKDCEVLVVPVGVKGHREETLQWRISFTLAELELVRSFSDAQIKVYVILKMLAKSQLKVISKRITSYIVKNVFFWLSERTGMVNFSQENINSMLRESLIYLKECITERSLPNYMIPERNHYSGISDRQRNRLLKCLDVLIEDRTPLLRCPEIKQVLRMNPCEAEIHIRQREVGEQLILSIFSLESQTYSDVLKMLFAAEKKQDVLDVFKREVLARRRQKDPFNFFSHIGKMTDDDLLATFYRNVTESGLWSCIPRYSYRRF